MFWSPIKSINSTSKSFRRIFCCKIHILHFGKAVDTEKSQYRGTQSPKFAKNTGYVINDISKKRIRFRRIKNNTDSRHNS